MLVFECNEYSHRTLVHVTGGSLLFGNMSECTCHNRKGKNVKGLRLKKRYVDRGSVVKTGKQEITDQILWSADFV